MTLCRPLTLNNGGIETAPHVLSVKRSPQSSDPVRPIPPRDSKQYAFVESDESGTIRSHNGLFRESNHQFTWQMQWSRSKVSKTLSKKSVTFTVRSDVID
jgi:hypothetical protein